MQTYTLKTCQQQGNIIFHTKQIVRKSISMPIPTYLVLQIHSTTIIIVFPPCFNATIVQSVFKISYIPKEPQLIISSMSKY